MTPVRPMPSNPTIVFHSATCIPELLIYSFSLPFTCRSALFSLPLFKGSQPDGPHCPQPQCIPLPVPQSGCLRAAFQTQVSLFNQRASGETGVHSTGTPGAWRVHCGTNVHRTLRTTWLYRQHSDRAPKEQPAEFQVSACQPRVNFSMMLHICLVVLGCWGQCPHYMVCTGQGNCSRKHNQCCRAAFQANVGNLEDALLSLSCLNAVQAMSVIKSLFLSQAVMLSFSLCCSSWEFFMMLASLFKWQSRSLCKVAISQNSDLFNSEVKWQRFDYHGAVVLESHYSFFNHQTAFYLKSCCKKKSRNVIKIVQSWWWDIPCFYLAFTKCFAKLL